MALESLVVVDADPRSRDAAVFGFERAGVTVHATADAREALALAETRVPQVVVASTRTAGMEAAEFVQAVRRDKRCADLPVILVGESARREALLAAGADDYLPRPAFLRDLVTLARLAASRQDDEVRAPLADYGLFFLARALFGSRRSAVLTIERGRRSGELRFNDGQLAAARVSQQTGANAFHQLLLWPVGEMHVRFGAPHLTGKRIQKPFERLLEDGARFVAEFERLAEKVGGPRVVYQLDVKRLAEVKKQVPTEVMGLVGNYDGERSLIDVVEDSPFKPFDTIVITHRLLELEAIKRRAEAAPSTLSAELRARDVLIQGAGDGEALVTGGEALGKLVAETLARADSEPASFAPRGARGGDKSRKSAKAAPPAPRTVSATPTAAKLPLEAATTAAQEKAAAAAAPPAAHAAPSAPAPSPPAPASKPPAPQASPPPAAAAPAPVPTAKLPPARPAGPPPEADTDPKPIKAGKPPPVEISPSAEVSPRPRRSGTGKRSPTLRPGRREQVDLAALERAFGQAEPREPSPIESDTRALPPRKSAEEPPPAAVAPRAEDPPAAAPTAPAATSPSPVAPPVAAAPPAAAAPPVAPPAAAPPVAPPAAAAAPPPAVPAAAAPPVAARPAAPAREPSGRHRVESGRHTRFDDLEEEFFARAADLHRVEPVDTFDDLDAPERPRTKH